MKKILLVFSLLLLSCASSSKIEGYSFVKTETKTLILKDAEVITKEGIKFIEGMLQENIDSQPLTKVIIPMSKVNSLTVFKSKEEIPRATKIVKPHTKK